MYIYINEQYRLIVYVGSNCTRIPKAIKREEITIICGRHTEILIPRTPPADCDVSIFFPPFKNLYARNWIIYLHNVPSSTSIVFLIKRSDFWSNSFYRFNPLCVQNADWYTFLYHEKPLYCAKIKNANFIYFIYFISTYAFFYSLTFFYIFHWYCFPVMTDRLMHSSYYNCITTHRNIERISILSLILDIFPRLPNLLEMFA